MSTRTGKIASLPFEVREELCQRLRNGQRGAKLMNWLHAYEPSINDQNLTNWRQGGYQDWLKEQKELDELRRQSESIKRELDAGGFDMLDRAIIRCAADLADADLSPEKKAGAISSLKMTVIAGKRAETDERRTAVAEANSVRDEIRFQRETCELFMKWYFNKQTAEIMHNGASKTDQIEALRKTFFADVDALEKSGQVVLPT